MIIVNLKTVQEPKFHILLQIRNREKDYDDKHPIVRKWSLCPAMHGNGVTFSANDDISQGILAEDKQFLFI